jgi:potassium-dependent mechanosensitive channel
MSHARLAGKARRARPGGQVKVLISLLALILALVTPCAVLAAVDRPPAGPAPGVEQKAAVPLAPISIPIPEITKRAEEVTKLLRDFKVLALPNPAIERIKTRLPEMSAQLSPKLQSTIETLKEDPPLIILDRMTQFWHASRLEVSGSVEILTKRATEIEQELSHLADLRASWRQTLADAQTSGTPGSVVQRVDAVLSDIEATRAELQAQRAATLVLQEQVAQEVARCQDALDRIDLVRKGGLAQTFWRSTPPIWSPELQGHPFEELSASALEAAEITASLLRQFVEKNAARLVFHSLFFIWLVLIARAARRWARGHATADEGGLPAAALFDRPYSSAAVAALASTFWIYGELPHVVGNVTEVLLLLPLLRIVRPMITPAFAPALYGLTALCLVDRVRAELAPMVPLADQAILLLEMLAAMVWLVWLLGSMRLSRKSADERSVLEGLLARPATINLALANCAVSFIAAAFGTMRFARMLGGGLFVSAFLALVAYVVIQVADGLLAYALRVWPLQRLGMVEKHRGLLAHRAHRLFCWIMAGTWLAGTLDYIGLLDSALAIGQAAMAAELRRGAISLSLGDILVLVLTVWVAFLLSRFIRFVLDEDVYPRIGLTLGLSYMISSLLHYAILFLGFLLAIAALGVDLNKVTVLAGAFGVGLGFGLQGVVNNFVSGLIVLFERPISVGDVIQMGELGGEVRRIGIRSTTVRTAEGAEVIVPNASLVAEKVTNWTLSDQMRRIDVSVGVAYGNAPDKVLELLRGVAVAHPYVLKEPKPVAFFIGFGDSAMNFELRTWTNRFDQWVAIRSELSVALYEALRTAGIEIPFPQHEVRLRQ